ncbi:MAG TPA: MlaD family protein [Gemmataceae bacterium]|nr:MlaD family protein [Gemmataceae bacterium]
MSERGQKIRLGVFVIGCVLAIVVLVILFGKQPAFLTTREKYVVKFKNAPGVGPGTPVRMSGVKIGQVSELELKPDEKGNLAVFATVLVDKKFLPRANETPTIGQSLLSGDTSIDFVPDPENKDTSVRDPGVVIEGRSAFDTRQAAVEVQRLVPSAEQSLAEIRKSFEGIRDVTPKIKDAATEFAALSRSLRETLPEVRQTNDSIRNLSDTTRNFIPELSKSNDRIYMAAKNWSDAGERANVILQTNESKINRTIEHFEELSDNLNRVAVNLHQIINDENQKKINLILNNTATASQRLDSVANNADQMLKDGSKAMKRVSESAEKADEAIDNLRKATKPLADRSESITRNAEETLAQLNRLILELRQFTAAGSRTDGSLGKLLNDPSLYNNLNDASIMLVRTMPRIDKLLNDLQVFADQIARHPEKLGIGGAVHPSSGVKESPFAPTQPNVYPK